ncbi:MAG: hypothetical protein Q9188_001883 [Gyalolechia gomerana]
MGTKLHPGALAPSKAEVCYDTSDDNIAKATKELIQLLGPDNVISDLDERRARSITKWSPAAPTQIPNLVVFPGSTADVSAILRMCSSVPLPVVGFCGGTSMPGALAATRGGICIDFNRMDKIEEIHSEDLDVVVQPAVDWQDLNAHLERHDLFFPPDPSPGAKIGGMIAMNCSGTNAYRYGPMRQWVVSITVVLADGTVVRTRRRPHKSSAGYDLTNLIVGSEGTLGLVTEAVLRLAPLPKNVHVAIASFPNVHAATKTAVTLVHSGLPVDALELLDKHSMWAINKSGSSSKRWNENATLFLLFSGLQLAVKAYVELAREAAEQNGCEDFEVSGDKETINAWWGTRKQVGPSLMALKTHPTDLFLNADTAVPMSSLADMIEETHQIIEEAGLAGSTLGHVGDGNYHTVIICPESERDKGEKILTQIQKRAIELEGTITGEHGIGFKLRDRLRDEVGPEAVQMMERIKDALDPTHILNPDKVIQLTAGF